jgi:HlyD family secretion protein
MRRTLLAVSLLAAGSCGGGSSAAPAGDASTGSRPPRAVQVAAAQETRLERTVALTGTLAAEDQVTVSFKVAGRLDALEVDLGSPVERGQMLGRLTPTDFALRVTQSEAALQQARAGWG